MADAETALRARPLTRESIQKARARIKAYIHQTPVVTCSALDDLASLQNPAAELGSAYGLLNEHKNGTTNHEKPIYRGQVRLWFKCENFQKIGAFKARGAFHALSHLSDGQLKGGVITHSSGNHAQAVALAARTRGISAHIIMPTISTTSKILATQAQGANVHFSGSTSVERENLTEKIQTETGAILIPPYDHPDIILGQGTLALEFEEQVKQQLEQERNEDRTCDGYGWRARRRRKADQAQRVKDLQDRRANLNRIARGNSESLHVTQSEGLDVVVAPIGGGGMLSGVATALHNTGVAVYGAEPTFEGADDCARGLASSPPKRIENVSTLTIADGLRTPVGVIPWTVVSDRKKVRGVFGVSEEEIKAAMRLLFERAKLMVEPSGAVALAVILFNHNWRNEVLGGLLEDEEINIGVVISGGNTTMEAIYKLFETSSSKQRHELEREIGKVDPEGNKHAENIAG